MLAFRIGAIAAREVRDQFGGGELEEKVEGKSCMPYAADCWVSVLVTGRTVQSSVQD